MKKLICVAAVLALCMPVFAQTAPPLKMGLWETTSSTESAMLTYAKYQRLKAGTLKFPSIGNPEIAVFQSCVTAETWQKFYGAPKEIKECTVSNYKLDSSGMSLDTECTVGGRAGISSIRMNILSPEKIHDFRLSGLLPRPNTDAPSVFKQTTADWVYLGPDCKRMSPGESHRVR
ncbi:MAG: DUF3617 domain-containing protein [Acidobacteriaceae bacterium]|nr:DUF3617 domain-containing protein [Acidobacteriaceae bacterium]